MGCLICSGSIIGYVPVFLSMSESLQHFPPCFAIGIFSFDINVCVCVCVQADCVEYDVPEDDRYSILENGRIGEYPESKYFMRNFLEVERYIDERKRVKGADNVSTFRMGFHDFTSLTLFDFSLEKLAT